MNQPEQLPQGKVVGTLHGRVTNVNIQTTITSRRHIVVEFDEPILYASDFVTSTRRPSTSSSVVKSATAQNFLTDNLLYPLISCDRLYKLGILDEPPSMHDLNFYSEHPDFVEGLFDLYKELTGLRLQCEGILRHTKANRPYVLWDWRRA